MIRGSECLTHQDQFCEKIPYLPLEFVTVRVYVYKAHGPCVQAHLGLCVQLQYSLPF
jgi:hypothetical protein